jgi:hypothetical protein
MPVLRPVQCSCPGSPSADATRRRPNRVAVQRASQLDEPHLRVRRRRVQYRRWHASPCQPPGEHHRASILAHARSISAWCWPNGPDRGGVLEALAHSGGEVFNQTIWPSGAG